jgi:hypothetical protein
VRNGTPRSWEIEYARIRYLPYWRVVLKQKAPVKLIPAAYSHTLEKIEKSMNKLAGQGSSLIPDLGLVGRFNQFSNQHKITFCSVAFPLLKVLRRA